MACKERLQVNTEIQSEHTKGSDHLGVLGVS
jgi:hypothetical protein